MRFILNFFFFGVLFYLIYVFFPDFFHTLVGWAQSVYEFFRTLFLQISERFHDWKSQSDSHSVRTIPDSQHALIWISSLLGMKQ